MLLQIKTSKVCARTEGRRSGYSDFYIFEREAVVLFSWSTRNGYVVLATYGRVALVFRTNRLTLYFFLCLCDYSDKFPKMFCSSWGMECPSTAISCHQCGQKLNLSQISAASSVDKEKQLKNYFHWGYPYTALIMCTSNCGSGYFKVFWCILSLILDASD